jgi:hypothetical protein
MRSFAKRTTGFRGPRTILRMPSESALGLIDDLQNRSPCAQLESCIKPSGPVGDSRFLDLGAMAARVPQVLANGGKSGGFQPRYPAHL